jgi:aspartate-semialdehyde dehydrogenase
MLNILAEREFPVDEIAALASRKSLGTEVSFGDKTLKTRIWTPSISPAGTSRCSPSGRTRPRSMRPRPRRGLRGDRQFVALSLRPRDPADRAGSERRRGGGYKNKNIIANPNCSTAQMVVALKPLHDRARIKRVVVSTYQSVSGTGKEAMDELWNQTKGMLSPVRKWRPAFTPSRSPST